MSRSGVGFVCRPPFPFPPFPPCVRSLPLALAASSFAFFLGLNVLGWAGAVSSIRFCRGGGGPGGFLVFPRMSSQISMPPIPPDPAGPVPPAWRACPLEKTTKEAEQTIGQHAKPPLHQRSQQDGVARFLIPRPFISYP